MINFIKQRSLIMKQKYKRLPLKLVRDKIPAIHENQFNVTVVTESARNWSLERKEELLVAKLDEELKELFAEFVKGDVYKCAQEIADVLDVIDAIRKHVKEDIVGKGFRTCGSKTHDLIGRARYFVKFIEGYFTHNSFFGSYIEDYRKSKKREKGLFTQLLVVKGEKKNQKNSILQP